MPRYDVRCRTCGDTFELTRSITRLDEPMVCPAGHDDTVRLLPAIGLSTRVNVGGGTSSAPSPSPSPSSGGGCCGGGCCG